MCFRFQMEVSGKSWVEWSSLEPLIDQLCTFKMSLRVTNQTASLIVMPALLTWTQNEGYLPTFFQGVQFHYSSAICCICFFYVYLLQRPQRKEKEYELWHYNGSSERISCTENMKCTFLHAVVKHCKYIIYIYIDI